MKYKGIYRILPELDQETNNIPREDNGTIVVEYDDIYITCQYGNKIYTYGHMSGNPKIVWLVAYIPSVIRGRNIKKALDDRHIEYVDYREWDKETEFKFKAKDINIITTLLRAKISGSNISPFSVKNLPKAKNVEIPSNEIERYKAILTQVNTFDFLILNKITKTFLVDIIEKRYKKKHKLFDVKIDMKKCLMSRMVKEYIWVKGFWDEYIKYLKEEINKFYNKQTGGILC